MSDRNSHVVRVYSQDVPVKSSESKEYINKLAEYVDARMNAFSSGSRISFGSLSILTSISIADELFKLKDNMGVQITEEDKIKDELSAALSRAMMLEVELHEKSEKLTSAELRISELESELEEKNKVEEQMREKFNVLSYELRKPLEDRYVDNTIEEVNELLPKKTQKKEKRHPGLQIDIESLL